jgi:hypothetical protein
LYDFYSAEYRAKVPRDEFLKQLRLVRMDLKDAAVVAAEVDATRARVTVKLLVAVPRLSAQWVESTLQQTWIKEPPGQTWVKLDEPLDLPFPQTAARPQ